MYLIDHEVNIPIWVDATNWNARRFFAKGKCSGVFVDSDEEDGEEDGEEKEPVHDRTKKLVHGRVWVDTNYHELLMFLVEEMHISVGGTQQTGSTSKRSPRDSLTLPVSSCVQE